ncbi:MAG: YceI family protein [Alphaproteobacteria bacterium]|nr:YceI family protein [Alphaproteobacteria bacterium]
MSRMLTAVLGLTVLFACTGEAPVEPPAEPVAPPAPKAATLPVKGVVDVITVKNETAEVPGRIEGVSGSLQIADLDHWKGLDGTISVDLATWNSGLELRDNRVKETFFEVASHGTATYAVSGVKGNPAEPLAIGGAPAEMTLEGQLTFHGATHPVSLPIKVARTAEQAFVVESSAPVKLDSDPFGLSEQREALRVLCAHDSLSAEVTLSVRVALGDAQIPGTEPPSGQPEGAGEADKVPPAEK